MQSVLQYRRIRRAVKRDLASRKATPRTASSLAGTVTPDSFKSIDGHDGQGEKEKEKEKESVPALVPGVTLSRPAEHDGSVTYVVGWEDGDPLNPYNWSLFSKWACSFAVCLLAIAISIPSSIDAPVAAEFNEHYGVNAMAGSMTTGMYLLGTGVGGLIAGTVSETFGRNVMYMTTFIAFMLFIMAKALAPDFGSALFFRFMTGFFGSTPMTAAGGSVADMWSPLEMIFSSM